MGGLVVAAALEEAWKAGLPAERTGQAEDVAALGKIAHDEELGARGEPLAVEEGTSHSGERVRACDDEVDGRRDVRGEPRVRRIAARHAPGREHAVESFCGRGGRGPVGEQELDLGGGWAFEAGAPGRILVPAGEAEDGAGREGHRVQHREVSEDEVAADGRGQVGAVRTPSSLGIGVEDAVLAVSIKEARDREGRPVEGEGLVRARRGGCHGRRGG